MATKRQKTEPPYAPCGPTVRGDEVCTFKGSGDPGLAITGIRDQTDTKNYIQYNSCMDLSPLDNKVDGPKKLKAMKITLSSDIMTAINISVFKAKKAQESPKVDLSKLDFSSVPNVANANFARRIVEDAIDRWLKGVQDSPNLLSNLANTQQCAQAPRLGDAPTQEARMQPQEVNPPLRMKVPYVGPENNVRHKIGGGIKQCYEDGGDENNNTEGCYYFKATNKSRCWLCGGSWYTTVNNHPLQYNCEHVLPYVEGSLMLGLADSGVKRVPGPLGGDKQEDRDKIFNLEYRWSHRHCNVFKNRGQFMDIRAKEDEEKDKPLLFYTADEEQIKNFCNELVGYDKDQSSLISPWESKKECNVGKVWKKCMLALVDAAKKKRDSDISNMEFAEWDDQVLRIRDEMNITPIQLRKDFIMPVVNDIAEFFYGAPIDQPSSAKRVEWDSWEAQQGREIIHADSFSLSAGVILYLKALIICSIISNLKRPPSGPVIGLYAKQGTDTIQRTRAGTVIPATRRDVFVNRDGVEAEVGDTVSGKKAMLKQPTTANPPYFPACLWREENKGTPNAEWVFVGDFAMLEIYRKALMSSFDNIITVLMKVAENGDDEPTGGIDNVISIDGTLCLFGTVPRNRERERILVSKKINNYDNIKLKSISKKKEKPFKIIGEGNDENSWQSVDDLVDNPRPKNMDPFIRGQQVSAKRQSSMEQASADKRQKNMDPFIRGQQVSAKRLSLVKEEMPTPMEVEVIPTPMEVEKQQEAEEESWVAVDDSLVRKRRQVYANRLIEALKMMKKELSNSTTDANQEKIYGGTKQLASTYLTKEMMYNLLLELLTKTEQELQIQGETVSIFNFTTILITVQKNSKKQREKIGGSSRPQVLAKQLTNLIHPLYLRSVSDAIPRQAEIISSKIKKMGIKAAFRDDIQTFRARDSIAQQEAANKRTKVRTTALSFLQKLQQKSRERVAKEFKKKDEERVAREQAAALAKKEADERFSAEIREAIKRGEESAAAALEAKAAREARARATGVFQQAAAKARATEELKKQQQLEAAYMKEKPFLERLLKKGNKIASLVTGGTFLTSPKQDVDPLSTGETGKTQYDKNLEEINEQMDYTLKAMNGPIEEGKIYGVPLPPNTKDVQREAENGLKEFRKIVEKNKTEVKENKNAIYELKKKIQEEAERRIAGAREELMKNIEKIKGIGERNAAKAEEIIKGLVKDYNEKLAYIQDEYKKLEPKLKAAIAEIQSRMSVGLDVALDKIKNSFIKLAQIATYVGRQIMSYLPGGENSSFANWLEAINYAFDGVKIIFGGAYKGLNILANSAVQFFYLVGLGIKTVVEKSTELLYKGLKVFGSASLKIVKAGVSASVEMVKAFLKWWNDNDMNNKLLTLLRNIFSAAKKAFLIGLEKTRVIILAALGKAGELLKKAARIVISVIRWLLWLLWDWLRKPRGGGEGGDEGGGGGLGEGGGGDGGVIGDSGGGGEGGGGMVWPDPTSEEESPPIYRRRPSPFSFRNVAAEQDAYRYNHGYLPDLGSAGIERWRELRGLSEDYGLLPGWARFGRTPESILKKKLQHVGINITKLTKTGKRLPLTRKELEERAMIFTRLQIKAKKLGIKLMYNSQTGRKYKSYNRLYNEVERNTISKMSTKELQTKLKLIGIRITYEVQGRRQYIPRKELERRALIFKQLQIKAKKLGIKLMYNSQMGRKYKSYKRLYNEVNKR